MVHPHYEQGAALAWGSAEWGQLGLGTMVTTQANPRLVRGVKSRVARCAPLRPVHVPLVHVPTLTARILTGRSLGTGPARS